MNRIKKHLYYPVIDGLYTIKEKIQDYNCNALADHYQQHSRKSFMDPWMPYIIPPDSQRKLKSKCKGERKEEEVWDLGSINRFISPFVYVCLNPDAVLPMSYVLTCFARVQ
jgi:hypothetical protein